MTSPFQEEYHYNIGFRSFDDEAWSGVEKLEVSCLFVSEIFPMDVQEYWKNVKYIPARDVNLSIAGLHCMVLRFTNNTMSITWNKKRIGSKRPYVHLYVTLHSIHCSAGVVLKTAEDIWNYLSTDSIACHHEKQRKKESWRFAP